MYQVKIIPADLNDYPIIQNLGKFYVYDISKYCGFISKEWAIEPDGQYQCFDLKDYFTNPNKKAFVVKLIDGELVGFVLLDKSATDKKTDWNMGEFFILAKFQGKKVASYVAKWIFLQYSGKWEVSVIPENTRALKFWRRTINEISFGDYKEQVKRIDYDRNQPNRVIFNFEVNFALRAGTDKDHQEVAEVSVKSWRDAYKEIMPKKYLDNLNVNEKVFNREYWYSLKNKYALLATLNDKIIGFCDYGNSRHLQFGLGEVYAIYVLPEFKAYKIGEKMIKAAIEDLNIKGFSPFVVTTIENNFAAREFYERQGFRPEGAITTRIAETYYPEIIYVRK